MNRIARLLMMGFLAFTMLSCGLFNFSRNQDGTYRVETNLPLQVVQTVIENVAQFSDVVDMKLELRDGYIFVSAAQLMFQGIEARDVSFHLELGSNNGQLVAAFTNVVVGIIGALIGGFLMGLIGLGPATGQHWNTGFFLKPTPTAPLCR